MTPAIIIDVIIAAILIAAVLIGARKGLFLSLAGIMIFLLALVGANIGAKSLSVPLADQLTPKIQERIAVRVEDTLQEKNQQSNECLEQMLPDSLKSILEHTGLRTNVLGQSAKGTITEISSAIAAAIARELAETFLYGILFLLLFLALLVLLWLAARGINLLLKLPVLSGMNALGGGIVGLVQGVLIVGLLIWLAPRLGIELPTDGSYLLRLFSAGGNYAAYTLFQM